MADFNLQNKVSNTGCSPSQPPPPLPGTDSPEYCEGTLTGSINGTVRMEKCCCCRETKTRTFIIPIPPQTDDQLTAFLQNTVDAYENAGYRINAHSTLDTGGGTRLGLTVAYYV